MYQGTTHTCSPTHPSFLGARVVSKSKLLNLATGQHEEDLDRVARNSTILHSPEVGDAMKNVQRCAVASTVPQERCTRHTIRPVMSVLQSVLAAMEECSVTECVVKCDQASCTRNWQLQCHIRTTTRRKKYAMECKYAKPLMMRRTHNFEHCQEHSETYTHKSVLNFHICSCRGLYASWDERQRCQIRYENKGTVHTRSLESVTYEWRSSR